MSPNSTSSRVKNHNKYEETNGKTQSTFKQLAEKKFVTRNSLIIDLCDNIPHIAAIQNLFTATIICLFTSILANDYLVTGQISFGYHLILIAFGKFHLAIFFWTIFFLTTCLVHTIFRIWAEIRIKLIPNNKSVQMWDRVWLVILVSFYILAYRVSSKLTVIYDMPIASSSIILLEQTRLLMKIHSYIRHNAEKIIKYKPHSDQNLEYPKFKNYLYFLFAPTLIYRDEYPRTTKIRWGFVGIRLIEIFGVIVYHCFIFHRFLLPPYREFGLRKYSWAEVIIPILENSICGLLVLMAGWYQVLHSVQNLFAELLRFGDRQFYMDWWNCTGIADYFRVWNIVVHDWLYTYIYRDIYNLSSGNKFMAKLMVFITSAVVHEWIISYQVKFFYPIVFYCYMAAVCLSVFNVPKVRWINILFWYGMAFGSGSILSLYVLEHYARTNNPDTEYSIKYWFLPRWYLCDCIV
ncbi:sterol O-acyltransferase 1 [Diorhabda carinulata]|uniref:sterol O-acyltransferase 1 n=1 Tax=Diorhabda carinulata TaxID=1163345 RepID=UPI0025A2A984|nr:sterol O-acyltransferase 1 [Diorhabda carinulata]XP_057667458.1 sterol O-acyltransferase 1 [Diorhabda carinulata]XP_057667459.1 sterol O-acyltransferase 1 [Diorhabda carinulata]XP_057667460.1 sterol O-acyltransferase 1 [Diorhabda carinulata]